MAKSWTDMVNDAKAVVTGVSPEEARQRLQHAPEALLIEVRAAESVPMEDRAPEVIMISLGSLPMRADLEISERLRDKRLEGGSPQVITTCGGGQMAALGAQVLHEMGFTNVTYMDGGMRGGKSAGLPTSE